jgi:hypothetical protein
MHVQMNQAADANQTLLYMFQEKAYKVQSPIKYIAIMADVEFKEKRFLIQELHNIVTVPYNIVQILYNCLPPCLHRLKRVRGPRNSRRGAERFV